MCGAFGHFQDKFIKNNRTKVTPFPFGDLKFTPCGTSQQNQGGLEMILTFFFRAWNVSVFFLVNWCIFGLLWEVFEGEFDGQFIFFSEVWAALNKF